MGPTGVQPLKMSKVCREGPKEVTVTVTLLLLLEVMMSLHAELPLKSKEASAWNLQQSFRNRFDPTKTFLIEGKLETQAKRLKKRRRLKFRSIATGCRFESLGFPLQPIFHIVWVLRSHRQHESVAQIIERGGRKCLGRMKPRKKVTFQLQYEGCAPAMINLSYA